MLSFYHKQGRVNCRVAGIAFRGAEVLLQTTDDDDFWTLPGGRVEFGESSRASLEREMLEEVKEIPAVDRLLWIVENFFAYNDTPYHEFGLGYLMRFASPSNVMQADKAWTVDEGDTRLMFQWWPIERLDRALIVPSFLPRLIANPPAQTVHIVHRDIPAD